MLTITGDFKLVIGNTFPFVVLFSLAKVPLEMYITRNATPAMTWMDSEGSSEPQSRPPAQLARYHH